MCSLLNSECYSQGNARDQTGVNEAGKQITAAPSVGAFKIRKDAQ